ncbi:helix-turn-helix transcriptional regulator [Paenibacillus endoradicis]|uniref:helix-turn-helix transcriptional regulator n=1 Tax=Paenibacillus endoradicis TaxID=2972487 RepID=UPI0021595D77|nr:AraC family transcriptional regulator [Paenibacillus endoradicis]MCR8660591.1 AraC family transcriptional regulator [Paenibacillus endoradicis]
MDIYYNNEHTMMIDHTKRKGFYTMQDQHSHDEYELYYLFTGERDYFIRDRTYRVKQGSFVFIDKDELHRTIDTGVPDHERLVINFDDSFLSNFPFQTQSGVITLPPQVQYKGENILQDLLLEAKGNANGRDIMLESLLRQLLLLVFRSQREQPEVEVQPSSVHQTMFEIATYVGTHYNAVLRLHDVAAQFFVSPYYLSRKFKQCTGFGFAEYVQLVRVREAQRLLRETNLKMLEIAEQIGMESLANFYKLFKQTNGCSPLQYRKRQFKKQT